MLSFIASNQSRPEPTEAPNLPNEPIQEPQAIRVNLRDYGFAKAGEHHGDASALANLFNQIRQGFILDENANGEKQQLERERIDEEVNGLERTTGELRTEIRRINETEIPKVEAAVQAIDDEINDIKLDVLKKTKEPHHRNRFNLIVYWSVFIPATLFLVLFYVSAFHAGFYRDVIGEAQRAGNDNINSVLNTIFNRQAFNELNLHLLSPIVFFVFGLILHIVY